MRHSCPPPYFIDLEEAREISNQYLPKISQEIVSLDEASQIESFLKIYNPSLMIHPSITPQWMDLPLGMKIHTKHQ